MFAADQGDVHINIEVEDEERIRDADVFPHLTPILKKCKPNPDPF